MTIGRILLQIAQFCRLTWFFLSSFFFVFLSYPIYIILYFSNNSPEEKKTLFHFFSFSLTLSLSLSLYLCLSLFLPLSLSLSLYVCMSIIHPPFFLFVIDCRLGGLGPLYHIKRLLIQYKWTRASFINGFYQFKTRSWFTHTLPYNYITTFFPTRFA